MCHEISHPTLQRAQLRSGSRSQSSPDSSSRQSTRPCSAARRYLHPRTATASDTHTVGSAKQPAEQRNAIIRPNSATTSQT